MHCNTAKNRENRFENGLEGLTRAIFLRADTDLIGALPIRVTVFSTLFEETAAFCRTKRVRIARRMLSKQADVGCGTIPTSLRASEAIQATARGQMDCFVAYASRKDAKSRSGRVRLWLLGLARLGADRLARGGRADAQRPAGRDRRDLGTGSEERPAAGTKLRFVPDHADRDAVDIRNLGTAKAKRIAAAGLLLLGRVGPARRRLHENRERRCQHQTNRRIPRPDCKHESPRSVHLRNCG